MAKKIKLTQGKFAIVDDEDFERVSKNKWNYHHTGYAVRTQKRKQIFMHRCINCTPDDKFTDHINGDRLDNRKENLRSCTKAENNRNKSMRSDNKSGVRGVSIKNTKRKKYWYARVKGKLGDKYFSYAEKYFPFTEEGKLQAARWYNEQAKKHFGEFAKLNEV